MFCSNCGAELKESALSAHKVFAAPGVLTTCWILGETGKRTGSFENVGGKGKD